MTERAPRDAHTAVIDQLIRELAWNAQKQVTHLLSAPDIDLTLPQMVTLYAIQINGSCRMSDLSEATQQSAGTLTGIVDRLIADGLVERVRNVADRRVVEVTLTSDGDLRLGRAVQACHNDMRRILTDFSEQDLARFEALLRQCLNGYSREANQDGHLSRVAQA